MLRYSEILRFHDGTRVQTSAPEATIETPPAGLAPDAGEQLIVLVDLGPAQAHLSRETRTIAARTYWQSQGGVVARVRRALAEANRYVLQDNARTPQAQWASGNITCAVFSGEDLFLGQVGPGNVLLYHPDGRVELFPSSALPMLPLGAALPPPIHLGYAPVAPGSALLIATASVAEAQARSLWVETLAVAKPEQSIEQVLSSMRENRVTGCAVVVHCLPELVPAAAAASAGRAPSTRGERLPVPSPSTPAMKPSPALSESPAPMLSMPEGPPTEKDTSRSGLMSTRQPPPVPPVLPSAKPSVPALTYTEPLDHVPPPVQPPQKRLPLWRRKPASRVAAEPAADTPLDGSIIGSMSEASSSAKPVAVHEPDEEFEEAAAAEPEGRPRWALKWPRIPWSAIGQLHIPVRRKVGSLLRTFGRALVPGKVASKRVRAARPLPSENPLLLGSVTLGLVLIIALLTLTTYFQFGGASRAEALMDTAEAAWQEAYASQASEDWQRALTLAEQVLALDSRNTRAQTLRDEAQLNLDVLENAAVLSVTKIAELGVSPAPRRILVSRSWIYLLNPVTDEILGMPLAEDKLSLRSAAPTTILRRGQIVGGDTVDDIVDIAWMTPGASYPDGAVFIYSDNGGLYIYEPALGPGGITRQQLEGEHSAQAVTMIATYGEQLYSLDRQQGQLFRYAPINGLYNSPPRPYFSPGSAPQLQTALGLSLDGRLYLLLGDGSVRTYFAGAEDPSFLMQGQPDSDLHPSVMTVEPDPDTGRIYLGDRQNERIVVFDKRGNYLHQFRVREGQLRQLEALVVAQEPRVLYMIAANGIYAATLPDFARR